MATILNSAILDIAMLHKTLTQSYSIWLKVIHSDSTWWWQPSWTLPSCIQPFAQKNFTHAFSLKLMIAAILNSAILDSDTAILDSNTLLSSLRFTQKHSYCTLTLTQTSSIWLKLIHSDSTWWWQPSWILPSWIQTLPSWIKTPCYLLSDLLKKHSHSTLTLTQTISIWLKLIHSHLTWWWQSILNSAILDSAMT